jgi:hypothetical protein
MNSDFVQQQAELLFRKIEAEPTSEGRIQKAYRLVFGRAATPEEIRLGLDYLKNEPLKEYEERKKAEEEKEKKKAEEEKKKAEADKAKTEKKEMTGKPEAAAQAPTIAPIAMPAPSDPSAPDQAMEPGGMMSGVVPGAAGKADEKKPLLPVTHWGRYLKILLSSTEYMFIN